MTQTSFQLKLLDPPAVISGDYGQYESRELAEAVRDRIIDSWPINSDEVITSESFAIGEQSVYTATTLPELHQYMATISVMDPFDVTVTQMEPRLTSASSLWVARASSAGFRYSDLLRLVQRTLLHVQASADTKELAIARAQTARSRALSFNADSHIEAGTVLADKSKEIVDKEAVALGFAPGTDQYDALQESTLLTFCTDYAKSLCAPD